MLLIVAATGARWGDPDGFEVPRLLTGRIKGRISGTMRDGTEVGMWVRATSCLRRQGGARTIVHEHASVPFDADTGRAVLRDEL
jgi:hypothetical protein